MPLPEELFPIDLEGDIKRCFDSISHDWLMRNIPMNRSVLTQFLKAGFIFDEKLYPTDMGTPQGGLVSPILANMTLDGVEAILSRHFPKRKVYFIRYADDFVVTAPTEEIAKEIREIIREFLVVRGLKLFPEKTKITHISEGFDFLGWNFRKYNETFLTTPSNKSIKSITQKIRSIVRERRAWTQDELIMALNPVIRGWANYHRHIVAKKTFKKLDAYIWTVTWRWAQRRHSNKGRKWIVDRYWQSEGERNWVFQTQENKLIQFSDFPIRRHAMPKLEMNPYLDRKYFLDRKERIKRQTPWIQTRPSFFAFRRPTIGL